MELTPCGFGDDPRIGLLQEPFVAGADTKAAVMERSARRQRSAAILR
jgi:hypothetical protein